MDVSFHDFGFRIAKTGARLEMAPEICERMANS